MLVLGLDTATPRSSVCLADERGLVAHAALGGATAGGGASATPRLRHGEFVAPAVRFCCQQAGIGLDAVAAVVVGLGPGLFTGLRVGVASAQAIAHVRRLPVVGLSSLEALAFAVRDRRGLVCACIDARRGELFWGWYRGAGDGLELLGEPRVGSPEVLAAEVAAADEAVLCVGDGALAQRPALVGAGAAVGSASVGAPDAHALVELALPRLAAGDTQDAGELRPIYLRSVDARIGWQTRGALRGGAPAGGRR